MHRKKENILRTMPYRRLLLLATGIGLLFSLIGPLNILMMPPNAHPSFLVLLMLTSLSGLLAFSIIALFRFPKAGVPVVALLFLSLFFVGELEEALTGARTYDKAVPSESLLLSPEKIEQMQASRMGVGVLGVFLGTNP